MTQLQKYIWLIDTIRSHGKISHRDLSDEWERDKNLSDYRPLHRGTFNRWRDAIADRFGIIIECQKTGGYLYYIANPEDIEENKLKQWMLDTFAVGNIINDNLALKERIIIDEIPSGHSHFQSIVEAMKYNRMIEISYRSFKHNESHNAKIEPYCVKLFENRWYVLAKKDEALKIYGLDRIEKVTILDEIFRFPKEFSAAKYFETAYGIVFENNEQPLRIVVRAYDQHKNYIESLPMHHTQKLIKDYGEYADFELYLVPTYDFIMRLLHDGAWIEVLSPMSLRQAMKGWISDMYDYYEND